MEEGTSAALFLVLFYLLGAGNLLYVASSISNERKKSLGQYMYFLKLNFFLVILQILKLSNKIISAAERNREESQRLPNFEF